MIRHLASRLPHVWLSAPSRALFCRRGRGEESPANANEPDGKAQEIGAATQDRQRDDGSNQRWGLLVERSSGQRGRIGERGEGVAQEHEANREEERRAGQSAQPCEPARQNASCASEVVGQDQPHAESAPARSGRMADSCRS